MASGRDMPTLGEIAESMEDVVSAKYRTMKNIVANFFRTLSPSHEVRASPKKGDKMTILEKGRSRVQTSPDEQQPGTSKSDRRESRPIDVKGKSGRKDSDLISTATSALRRLNFRTAGGSHHRRGAASAPAGRNGSPLIHTSSSASETNTSQESSHTCTSLVPDAEQGQRTEQDLLESRALLEDEEGQEGEDQLQRAENRPDIRSREILKDFDKLIYENQQLLNAEKARIRAAKNAAKFNQGPGAAAGGSKKGTFDKKKQSSTVTTQEKVDKGKSRKFDWSQRRGRQSAIVDDRQMPSCAPEPSPPASMFPQEQSYFSTPSMLDEDVQDFDLMNESKKSGFSKPKTVKTIQSELPQRTFSTNFSKRKKMGDQKERKDGQAEEGQTSHHLSSPSTSSRPNVMDDISFELPPRRYSPSKVAMSSSPRLGRETSTSSRKISSAPVTPPTLKEESAMTKKIQNATLPLETQEMQAFGEDKKFGESTSTSSDFTNGPSTSKNMGDESRPSTSKGHTKTSENMGDEPGPSTPKGHTKTSKNTGDKPGTSTSKGHNIKDNGRAYSDDAARTSHKRKKRHDRKPSNGDNSSDDKKFFRIQNSRDAFFCSLGEPNIVLPQNPKYSVLATDGSVKNFVSENSGVFKNSGENINKENIKKSGEFPERHRRVSIIQGQSLRHFIFREPDTSQIKPSKQRKVAQVIEDTTRRLLLEDVQPRKASLAKGDTTKDESPGKSNASDDKQRKFSINTLGDIVSARKFSLLPPGEIYTSQGSNGQLTEVIKLAPVANGKPLATIVVQQASIQRGSIQSEDPLLDVTTTFNLAELGDLDLRYGSPHHFRSQSVKTPGRLCGHPNYLCLPQQRARVASMPNTGVEEEYYRLRNFSITGKGLVNRGDSLKSRRSRSNTSVASSNSSHSNSDHVANVCGVGSHPGTARNSAECSLASSRDSSTANLPYRVILLGSEEVGKTALISQFMTSEYLNAYEASLDEEEQEKSVSVLLDGEESELLFYEHPSSLLSFDDGETISEAQAYVIVYSVVDRESFQTAERILQYIWRNESIATKAVILVGNKGDLARSRAVLYDEGIDMANAYDCKFIETSAGINHNVDELLAGILSQIRLKLKRAAKEKEREQSPRRWRNTRLSASLKVKDDGIDGEGVDVTTDLLRGNLLKIYYNYEEEWFHRKRGEFNDNDNESFTDEDVNNDIHVDVDDSIECNVNHDTEHDASANDQNRGKRACEIKKRETVSKIKRVRKDKKKAPSSAAEASSNVAEASSHVAEAPSNAAEAPSNAADAPFRRNVETNMDTYKLMFSPEILHYLHELDIIKNDP